MGTCNAKKKKNKYYNKIKKEISEEEKEEKEEEKEEEKNITFQNEEYLEKIINKEKISIKKNNSTEAKAIYYPNEELNETIIKIEIKGDSISNISNSEFIFILDISGSMGNYVNQILQKVIPKIYTKLNYPNEKIIHLITFQTSTNYYKMTKNDFINSKISGNGGTNMSGIAIKLENIFNNLNPDTSINLLTLSDGEINDQNLTKEKIDNLYNLFGKKFYNFNSQAIRFHSYDNAIPDTRALCSLLRFNNKNNDNYEKLLINFNPLNSIMTHAKIEEFSNIISNLFKEEISGWKIICNNGDKKLRVEPLGKLLSSVSINKRQLTLFYDGIFNNNNNNLILSSIDGNSKNISFGEKVTQENLNDIYNDIIYGIFDKVIINKCVDSIESNKKNQDYINYIEMLENKTIETNIIHSKNNIISNKLNTIINNDKIKRLNNEELNNFIQKEKNEFIEKLKEIKNQINEMIKISSNRLIILLDNSKYMKKYINDLMQNIIYQSLIKKGINLKSKIIIFGFKDYERRFILKKLSSNLSIECSGERIFLNCLKKLKKEISENKGIHYTIITIFSGEISDKKEIRNLLYGMKELNKINKININIVKYIIDNSDFPKNKNGEIDKSKEDNITYGYIKQLNSEGFYSLNPFTLYNNLSNDEKINQFCNFFNSL